MEKIIEDILLDGQLLDTAVEIQVGNCFKDECNVRIRLVTEFKHRIPAAQAMALRPYTSLRRNTFAKYGGK